MGSLTTALKVLDPLVVVLAALVSYWLRFDDLELPPIYQAAVLASFALSVLAFALTDLYRGRPDEGLRRSLVRLFTAWLAVVLSLVLVMYATRTGAIFSRQWLGVWSVLALVMLFAVRLALASVQRVLQKRGYFVRRVAIAGAGRLGRQVARRLGQMKSTGLRVVAFFDDAPALAGQTVEGVPVLGSCDAIAGHLRSGVDQLWIALPLRAEERVKQVLDVLGTHNVEVRFVPDIFSFRLLNHSVEEVGGLPVIKITDSPMSGAKGALKWLEDKLVALGVLAVIWPLMIAIAIAIKLSSPGPVLFRQPRGGLDNREIVVWKFRTMVVHEEPDGTVTQAKASDARITPFGAFLRRTSLDELPQFINVLTGQMSVVGPRPHALSHNDFYRERLPNYVLRSWIKPGITGWAQICGWRGETDEDWKMEMRVQHDLYYIENWSLGFDFYIILMTLFRMRGERAY